MWKNQVDVEAPNKMLSSVLAPGFDDKVILNSSSELFLIFEHNCSTVLPWYHTWARVIDLSCSASRDFFKLRINSCVPRCPSPRWQARSYKIWAVKKDDLLTATIEVLLKIVANKDKPYWAIERDLEIEDCVLTINGWNQNFTKVVQTHLANTVTNQWFLTSWFVQP